MVEPVTWQCIIVTIRNVKGVRLRGKMEANSGWLKKLSLRYG